MSCDAIHKALAAFQRCETTPDGARILTHCLLPSFEPVAVFILRFGDGYIVHDGGAATSSAWIHGRDQRTINRYLGEEATRYGLTLENGQLSIKVQSEAWLSNAVLAVSNAAASGASAVVRHVARAASFELQDRIRATLEKRFIPSQVIFKPLRVGNSGKSYEFDFAVVGDGELSVIIDAVTPHPLSIYSKYTAFSDIQPTSVGTGLAVYEAPLAEEDKTLLSSVVDVVPFDAMVRTIQRSLLHTL